MTLVQKLVLSAQVVFLVRERSSEWIKSLVNNHPCCLKQLLRTYNKQATIFSSLQTYGP